MPDDLRLDPTDSAAPTNGAVRRSGTRLRPRRPEVPVTPPRPEIGGDGAPGRGGVCIVGAGSSGIVAAKTFHERGIPFECFEMGSGIGGNWRYLNDNGVSAAYRSLHINTNRDRMAYSDFPMPADYPHYPSHRQILAYFEDYVDHFGFRDRITFRTRVERVEPADPTGERAGYLVTTRHLDTGETDTRRYEAVVVANGHHWKPSLPDFPGHFDGEAMHSHAYKTPEGLVGKRVLVVGAGNSACDIAVEASRVAERTLLSTRRGAHVIPKFFFGLPADNLATPLTQRLPVPLQRALLRAVLLVSRGRQAGYGMPEPEHPLLAEHPTISDELLGRIAHGAITVKPNIERLLGDRVWFADGTEEGVDVIVYATGYDVSFPFLDDEVVQVEDNRVRLFRHVVMPRRPGLYFLGLVQPLGAIMPLAEAQAEWIADLLEGEAGLPEPAEMEAAIARAEARTARRYYRSKRHTMQVDFYPYKAAVERERRLGRRRPKRQALRTGVRLETAG